MTYFQLRFECPVCGKVVKADCGQFKCNHQDNSYVNPDPDTFEIDEMHIRLVVLITKED